MRPLPSRSVISVLGTATTSFDANPTKTAKRHLPEITAKSPKKLRPNDEPAEEAPSYMNKPPPVPPQTDEDAERRKKKLRAEKFKRLREKQKQSIAVSKFAMRIAHSVKTSRKLSSRARPQVFDDPGQEEKPSPARISLPAPPSPRLDLTPETAKEEDPAVDALDAFMVGVEKQVERDVGSTLRKLAKHKKKEEETERERQLSLEAARAREHITREEIENEFMAEDVEDEDEPDPEEFVKALRAHIGAAPKGVLAITDGAAAPPAEPEQGFMAIEDTKESILLGVEDHENDQDTLDAILAADATPVESNDPDSKTYFELLAIHGSKKELPVVDHSTIDYPSFDRNIYVQVREITDMNEAEVDALRRTNGHIRIRGKGCPRPIREFSQCGLPDSILQILEKAGCVKPFPIQMQSIPALMAGRNVIGVAETGSGKTLAYLLPLIRHVSAQTRVRDGEGPIALVIGPTRELVQQIAQEARRLIKPLNLRCALVYGGGGIGTQLSELKRGCEILVGTPGRLTEVLTINKGKITNLRRVTFLVLDEADRMFDLGFGPQVERIVGNVRPDRQMALFSATFPSQIENLARKSLYKPLEIIIGDKGRTASSVTQFVEVFETPAAKFRRLLHLLGEWYEHGESILIFVSRQSDVDDLCVKLLDLGYPCLSFHGGQDQEDREQAVADFKTKRETIMVATSIASRGLDVKSIVLVVNYSAPDHIEDYIHRIGRTGRGGNIGAAYTFFLPNEADKAPDVIRALRESSQSVPPELEALAKQYEANAASSAARASVSADGTVTLVPNAARKSTRKGFGGRGYRFVPTEQSASQEARSFWKKELGIGDSKEEEPEPEASTTDASVAGATSTPVAGPSAVASGGADSTGSEDVAVAAPPTPDVLSIKSPPPGVSSTSSFLAEIEAKAQQLIASWTAAILDPVAREMQTQKLLPVIKGILAQQAGATLTANSDTERQSPDVTALVQQALMPLRGNLAPGVHWKGQAAVQQPLARVPQQSQQQEYIDQTTGNYVILFNINDYPAQARHRASHKETLHHIADMTGANLQVRGVYIDPDKRKQNPLAYIGSRDLHVEITASTQVAAQKARRELHVLVETIAKKQLNLPSAMGRLF